jgi:hypothetical protein
MLLVKVMIPLVYAGANVFIAHCLFFFGQYVCNEHLCFIGVEGKMSLYWYPSVVRVL